MTVEAMWRRPVCVGGIVCNAVFFSVLPFSEIMLRTYWRVMPWQTFFFFLLMTPSDENKKAKSCLYIHLACPGQHRHRRGLRSKKIKKKMHCKIDREKEIALNLFSIFTVYNICHVIYSQRFVHIYICTFFSIAFTLITLIESLYPAENTVSK